MIKHQTPLMDSIAAASAVLYLAIELSVKQWHLLFGDGQRRRKRVIEARDLVSLLREIGQAKEKLKLPADTLVVSCFEAGRDGHWLHRALTGYGVVNLEVASTSIKVSQQGKHCKTDRLDVAALLSQLYHYAQGDQSALQVVNVPSPEAEDRMRLDRLASRLKKERSQHRNRLYAVLIRHGLRPRWVGGREWSKEVDALRDWAGQPLPAWTQQELRDENERLLLVERQLHALEAERTRLIREGRGKPLEQVRQLMLLRSVGPVISWRLAMEFYSWRAFRNRKQIGALSGLAGTPHRSGDTARELGISKAGNPRIRALAIELAWLWVRWQPNSKWSQWFARRYAQGGKRQRKIGIVGVARHLLIDLWRYLEAGVVPEGAVLKQP